MLLLLSPAKRLDYDTPLPRGVRQRATEPAFLAQASALIDGLKTLSASQVGALMALSDDLASLNAARYKAWTPAHDNRNSRPALLAFDGDVYAGLQARSLDAADMRWAQSHLVILSGLYGALRPLDRLQPYRLEMGTRLANPKGADLYAYWGDTVAGYLDVRLAADRQPVVVNLASQEYFKVVDRAALAARVVDCVFEDWKDGQYKVIGFFAKRARGAMARWAILKRARSPRSLRAFAEDGYALAAKASTADRLVFRRRVDD